MHIRKRRGGALLLLASMLLALTAGVSAADAEPAEDTLEARVAQFMEENYLNEQNFSMSYYNTVTGESYAFEDTHMMVAASTYKLPLNLYYYQQELAGEIAPDALIAGVYRLSDCHYQSLVWSNNEISEAMLYQIGSFQEYKQTMRTFTDMTDDEIDPRYYSGNLYCTRMMMDALKYLYDHAADYEEMLSYMKEASPQNGYFRKYVTECEVAHKYGSFEGAENDTGIIYAGQPFLLAVYTQDVAGEEICAKAARLMKDYTDEQYAIQLEQERLETERCERAERLEAYRAAQEESQEGAEEREALRTEQREAVKARLLAAEAERLAEELERLRPDAAAYAQFRERIGAIECEARKRAADLEESTQMKLHRMVEQFHQQYTQLMSTFNATATHVNSELRKVEVTLTQLPRALDCNESELKELASALEQHQEKR